jgi:hypothetical protein
MMVWLRESPAVERPMLGPMRLKLQLRKSKLKQTRQRPAHVKSLPLLLPLSALQLPRQLRPPLLPLLLLRPPRCRGPLWALVRLGVAKSLQLTIQRIGI